MLEGIQPHRELIKALTDYKQGKVLESNYYTTKVSYPKDSIAHFSKYAEVGERIKYDMIQKISATIYPKLAPQIQESETTSRNSVDYSLEFMLIQPHELKHIVEYCVRHMPQQALDEIRNTTENKL